MYLVFDGSRAMKVDVPFSLVTPMKGRSQLTPDFISASRAPLSDAPKHIISSGAKETPEKSGSYQNW